MTKGHAFEPGVVQVRRRDGQTVSWSRCRLCGKLGRLMTRWTDKGRRQISFWQHGERPLIEPAPEAFCEWQGAGGIWCCKNVGHDGGHHAHRGPRRTVHAASV